MSNSITSSNFHFDDHLVRVTQSDGELWFVAQDVMTSLDYSTSYKPATALSHVPEEWKGVFPIHTLGGQQKLLCLSEPGLYFFLGRSDKPKALPFQKWVYGEVLPSIRKTGSYKVGQQQELSIAPVAPQIPMNLARVYHAASQAGAKLQEAVFLELSQPGSKMNARMQITLDEGNPRIKFIDDAAYITPPEGFANAIRDCSNISPEVLSQINAACTARLKEMATVLRTKPKLESEVRRAQRQSIS